MSKKPPTPKEQPQEEPKKRPARKAPAPKGKAAPAKKAAKGSPAKKVVLKKPTSDQDPSAVKKKAAKRAGPKKTPAPPPKPFNVSDVIARVSATSRKSARKVPVKAAETSSTPDEDAATPDDGDMMGCTPRQSRFVDLYLLLNFNATRAYMEAGYEVKSENVASTLAARMLGTARVRALLAHRSKLMVENAEAEKTKLIRSFTETAYADPRELTEYHVGSCRYCYGKAFRYQYTAGEWDQKMVDFEERQAKIAEQGGDPSKLKAPEQRGGTGYDWRKAPNPECPECFGYGKGREVMKDTRNLSAAGVALFAGVEVTKDGLKIKMHDQMRARDTLAKYRKVYEDVTEVNVNVTSTKELDDIYAAGMKDTAAGKKRVEGRGERLRAGTRARDGAG